MISQSYIKLMMIGILCTVWLCAGGVGLSEDEDIKSLRVARIGTNRFDYIFTSYVPRPDGGWVLSFNDLNQRTYFKNMGEKLGDYTIVSFLPVTEETFNSAINMTLYKKAGTVVLKNSRNDTVQLEFEKEYRLPGWLVQIVSLNTGIKQFIRKGDRLSLGQYTVEIQELVDKGVVAVMSDGGKIVIPVLTDNERAKLDAMKVRKPVVFNDEQQEIDDVTVAADNTTLRAPPLSVEVRYIPNMRWRYPIQVYTGDRVLYYYPIAPWNEDIIETRILRPGLEVQSSSLVPSFGIHGGNFKPYHSGRGMIPFPSGGMIPFPRMSVK